MKSYSPTPQPHTVLQSLSTVIYSSTRCVCVWYPALLLLLPVSPQQRSVWRSFDDECSAPVRLVVIFFFSFTLDWPSWLDTTSRKSCATIDFIFPVNIFSEKISYLPDDDDDDDDDCCCCCCYSCQEEEIEKKGGQKGGL